MHVWKVAGALLGLVAVSHSSAYVVSLLLSVFVAHPKLAQLLRLLAADPMQACLHSVMHIDRST